VDVFGLLILILQIYFYAVLVWVILSWIPTSSGHPLGKVSMFLDRIIFPVIMPLRRVIPPLRIGGGMLDLTPIVLLIGINLLIRLIANIG
jgi:YggT family protein